MHKQQKEKKKNVKKVYWNKGFYNQCIISRISQVKASGLCA